MPKTNQQALDQNPTAFGTLDITQVKERLGSIRELRGVMIEGIDYGVIPYTKSKPTLLKPGAEKLCALFSLASKLKREVVRLDNSHREYLYTCELYHIPTGHFVGSGDGSCSTLESKYRYQFIDTKKFVPKEYWDNRDQKILGGGYARKSFLLKDAWTIHNRVEAEDIADKYNTVMKVASKRSLLAATLIVTNASETFTQDLEEQPREEQPPPPPQPPPQPPPVSQWKNEIPPGIQKLFSKHKVTAGEIKEILDICQNDMEKVTKYMTNYWQNQA